MMWKQRNAIYKAGLGGSGGEGVVIETKQSVESEEKVEQGAGWLAGSSVWGRNGGQRRMQSITTSTVLEL